MKNIKVMIIDDSSTIRRSAELFLSNAGYTVVTAEDGFEGLVSVVEESPDIIFIDVIMPKLDGLQTCQIIKRNPSFKNIPVIFLSSKDTIFDIQKGYMMGGSDYLTKPFTKESINAMVVKHIKK